MFSLRSGFQLLTALSFLMAAGQASAQGLIFSLPEDGKGVEYEGTITYTTVRADIDEGRETITKAREMSIKSVGKTEAEFNGQMQPCRWIEIKIVTGTAGEGGIDPGPVGSRIYSVLVPESKIISTATDADSIPNITLPIVKGYRRSGEAQRRDIKSKAISFYPTICQLVNYPEPEVVAEAETPETKSPDQFTARHLKGRMVMERPESRSTNEGHFWVSEGVPFGLARWEVTVTREQKESTASRDDFKEVTTTTSEMSVRKLIPNAEPELIIPDLNQ